MAQHKVKQAVPAASDDVELVRRALARDAGAFRAIMQKHNRRLYRIARGVLRNDTDAEDAVQDAYVSAFTNLATYRGESTLATWLSRIVMNEALGRLRRKRRTVDLAALEPMRGEAESRPQRSGAIQSLRKPIVSHRTTVLETATMMPAWIQKASVPIPKKSASPRVVPTPQ